MTNATSFDWDLVDTVLLDMDGTLLDLRFDTWFWHNLVPARFAQTNGLSVEQAQARLAPMFLEVAGTLPWYCIDHWSRELNLDIRALKRAVRERVQFLPGAERFLEQLQGRGKRVVLVTNSHPATLAIKDEQVSLTRYFHACYSTHAFDVPKEHAAFWPRLAAQEPFDAPRTLFIDDSLPVLECARDYGIGHLRAVRHPDSGAAPQSTGDFAAIDGVAQLLG
jgi:putative hydrolase of the HAD superfamily